MHSVMTTGSSSASLVGCSLLAPHHPTLQEAPSKEASEDFGTVSSFSCMAKCCEVGNEYQVLPGVVGAAWWPV